MASSDPALRWTELAGAALLPGITVSLAHGDRLTAALYSLEPGAVVPEHSHDNEEFGQVLAGSLELIAGGKAQTMAAGEGFLLPGGAPHSAVAGPAGCQLLECYAPPRDPVSSS
ncbi:MAG TPA: cupin domain-containing protein [Streptosporangiaceae bacterium]|nr:cupin domain-containing protein [Streptosporangiaceae bacterium]